MHLAHCIYGTTAPDGAARVEYQRKRTKGSWRAPVGPLKRDCTRKTHVPVPRYAPELMQAARALGMSCAKLQSLIALQQKYGK